MRPDAASLLRLLDETDTEDETSAQTVNNSEGFRPDA